VQDINIVMKIRKNENAFYAQKHKYLNKFCSHLTSIKKVNKVYAELLMKWVAVRRTVLLV